MFNAFFRWIVICISTRTFVFVSFWTNNSVKFDLWSEQKSSSPSMLFTSTSLWIGKEIFSLRIRTTCGDHKKIRIHVLHPEHTLSDNLIIKWINFLLGSLCNFLHGTMYKDIMNRETERERDVHLGWIIPGVHKIQQ